MRMTRLLEAARRHTFGDISEDCNCRTILTLFINDPHGIPGDATVTYVIFD
jgi:hypothetical protein